MIMGSLLSSVQSLLGIKLSKAGFALITVRNAENDNPRDACRSRIVGDQPYLEREITDY